jgi:predicted ATPase
LIFIAIYYLFVQDYGITYYNFHFIPSQQVYYINLKGKENNVFEISNLINIFKEAFCNDFDNNSSLGITNENVSNYFNKLSDITESYQYQYKDNKRYIAFFTDTYFKEFVLRNKEYLLEIDNFKEQNNKIIINKNDLLFKNYFELISKYTSMFRYYNINFRENKIVDFSWATNEKININAPLYLLSTGEYSILSMLSRLYAAAQEKKTTYIYIIDEGEVSLHPNWQTKYLNILINTINEYSTNKIHLILATHSPFVLSDLPRENVVFLQKDTAGKCQVVKNPMERPQTFASNIHTLFAEGFFMREGTIGHFAKSKIEKVLTYLSKDPKEMNDKGKSEYEEITKIINLIGEPLIKNKLLRMIQDRNTLTVDERINNLQAQIDELKKQK